MVIWRDNLQIILSDASMEIKLITLDVGIFSIFFPLSYNLLFELFDITRDKNRNWFWN